MNQHCKSGDPQSDFAREVADAIATANCANPDMPNFNQNSSRNLTATTETLSAALKEFSTPKASESVSQLLALGSDNPEIARKAKLKEIETVKIRAYITQLLAMKDGDPVKAEILESINYYLKIYRFLRPAENKSAISEQPEK
jgi:DNA-binding NarL/FixJ family response regulator